MIGLDASTGRALAGDAHLQQSIHDILSTPVGTRVMRRSYGSRVPDLIDAPLNARTIVEVYAAVAEALDLWEPRIRLGKVDLIDARAGKVEIALSGEYVDRAGQSGVDADDPAAARGWEMTIALGGQP